MSRYFIRQDTLGERRPAGLPRFRLPSRRGELPLECSLLGRIGNEGLERIVEAAKPRFPKSIVSVPYGRRNFKRMLRKSTTVKEFKKRHFTKVHRSRTYRTFRLSYHIAARILSDEYGISQ